MCRRHTVRKQMRIMCIWHLWQNLQIVSFFFLFLDCFAQLAVEFSLPIIDLSRTFDPNNKNHYGSTPIEPSNTSGQFIADLIAQVRMFPSVSYRMD